MNKHQMMIEISKRAALKPVPVFLTGTAVRWVTQSHSVDSHHPEYRRVLRALRKLAEIGVLECIHTVHNEAVWCYLPRITHYLQELPF